jgi:hypothetical protein
MYIYVASSWRCERQPMVVAALRSAGHEVYDFRNPAPGNHGFGWRQIRPEPPPWSAAETREVLAHPVANEGFRLDFEAMKRADVIVMVQPCGRSAALELGWGVGAGKRTCVLLADGQEPELMLKCADRLCTSLDEVLAFLAEPASKVGRCSACGVGRCPTCDGAGRRAWLRPDATPSFVVHPRDAILGPCPMCCESEAAEWLKGYRTRRNVGRCPSHDTALALSKEEDGQISASCPTCATEGHPWVFRVAKGKKPFKAFSALLAPTPAGEVV